MLDAARQVLAEKGYAGATLDEIAHRAEFGKGTLYNYFPGGKEEILFAVVEDLFDDLRALVEESFQENSPFPARVTFDRFIERCLAHFEERRELFLILMKEAHRMGFSDDAGRVRFFLAQRSKVAEALAEPIRRAIAAGEMRPLPPVAVANMLIGNIQGCQMHLSLQKSGEGSAAETWSVSDAARFLSDMLFDGLLTTPRSSSGSDLHVH